MYPVGDQWHFDISFRNLPPGMHPVVRHPKQLETREEALSTAIDQLSACAQRDKTPLPDRLTGLLGFQFDEVLVPVDYGMYAHFKEVATDEGFKGPDQRHVHVARHDGHVEAPGRRVSGRI